MKRKVGAFFIGWIRSCLLFLPFFLGSCIGVRYLEHQESILYSQSIDGTDEVDADDLDNLYRQEPNSRPPLLPWAPYVAIYQWGLNRYDQEAYRQERAERRDYFDSLQQTVADQPRKLKRVQRQRYQALNKLDKSITEGNLAMRWGEPLAVYDPNQTAYTAKQMQQYLSNRGYFENVVTFQASTNQRLTRVTYQVQEGKPYKIDSLVLVTRDTAIAGLIEKYEENSLLKIGDNYDSDVIEDERNRIDVLLKDHGYYTFSRNYIYFEADTSYLGDRKVVIRTLIRTPEGQDHHKVYTIDSVIVTTDANIAQPGTRLRERSNGLVYQYFEKEYATRILDRRIFLYPDSLYSRSNTLNTQRQLANLDNFKFINVKYDTLGGEFIARVYMSPLPKRQISDEIGLLVSQAFPGPLVNVTFTNRNVFKHLENLQMTGRFSIEGVPQGDTTTGTSTEASVNASLFFPQFLIPGGEQFKQRLGYANPRTRAQIGYAFNNRPEYNRTTVNAGFVYTWETLRGTRYSYNLWDLSLIQTQDIAESFQTILDEQAAQGNNLRRTFEPSLVSSMQVSATYNFLKNPTNDLQTAYLRVFLDMGGTIWNVISPTSVIPESLGLATFQYLKFNTDFIRYRPLRDNSVLAYRFNIGMAGSYDQSNPVLPFEKYFFAGGSNSIRAWSPRRLGPGSYRQEDDDGNIQLQFDQQGEILLASSVEWRRNIFDFIDGALFVDVGNTWTFREESARPGANFEFNRFWNEFAVGMGAGIRADFSFLILRLDVGVKTHDPAFPIGERWFPSEYPYNQPFMVNNPAYTLNLGIGYPF
ncbi:MAG TPA: hypothetical protein DCE41_19820 [Cytophagales bacterium]|nr:hypothetical protein [Cytophagales bacterium]HAA19363.1 hypothetical protein [Cytophagales bacterium]HAP64955.1 hypothetical protein [Cytophagales bacterium]